MNSQIAPLGFVIMNGMQELGAKVAEYLSAWLTSQGKAEESFLVDAQCPRFATGDCKGLLQSSVRGLDLYILIDVGNYNCKYTMFGRENMMSPDDHFQDLKRIVSAAGGKAHRINVIMPILYGGQQHRRIYRESLDGALALQELARMGVSNIVTFDAHDPRVENAIPLMGFDNIIPRYQALKALFARVPDINITPETFMVVAPDEGAITRNMYYASVLGVPLGMHYKQRDFSKIVLGRNPIVAHEYLGQSVKGKDVFVADDIIRTGDSVLDIAHSLKERGARRLFFYATYAMMTQGLDRFDKAYGEGLMNGLLSTNLTYRTPELLSREWYYEVDLSKYIAYFISALNSDTSVTSMLDPHAKIEALLKRYKVNQ